MSPAFALAHNTRLVEVLKVDVIFEHWKPRLVGVLGVLGRWRLDDELWIWVSTLSVFPARPRYAHLLRSLGVALRARRLLFVDVAGAFRDFLGVFGAM